MAGVPVRAPFQPRSKSHAIANTPNTAQPPSTPNPPLRSNNSASADAVSDRSTLLFIRRTLCSHVSDKGRSTPAPIDEILPPLTSSNEVDLQLYAFIAIIIREFVNSWYAKITPDQVFVEEIVKIIAHCTRALEQRLRKVDLESLLFEELPDLLDTHVRIYRTAHYPLHPPPVTVNPRQVYHSLWPCAPLSPVPVEGDDDAKKAQSNNEAAYRQLTVYGILAVLLPTEDLDNGCLTSLVGQIFSEMILGGGIGGKACEPWLLWEGIMKIAEVIQNRPSKSESQVHNDMSDPDAPIPHSLDVAEAGTKFSTLGCTIQKTFTLGLHYLFLAFAAIRTMIIAIATSSSLPSRVSHMGKITGSTSPREDNSEAQMNSEAASGSRPLPFKQPILTMKLWSCVSTLLDMETRMPWLSATISLLQWGAITGPGKVGDTDGMIDKILSHQIHTHLLDPSLLAPLLRTTRLALFPNNTLAPARVPPTPAEIVVIRRKCAEAILALIPMPVRDVYFGSGTGAGTENKEERHIKEVEDILDVFSDVYCNKHLLYAVVELIVIRLIPELAEKGVEELWAERLS
ncbi:PXA domain-containing protein [Rutstroemia sp. NJR-2017a BBW]|nr:PXA domain-containing protein [Rutstroemia sp. NJR-2017a BBW]